MATIELKKIDSNLVQKTIILTRKEAVEIAAFLLAHLGDTNIRNNQVGACPTIRSSDEFIYFSVSNNLKDEYPIREIKNSNSYKDLFFVLSKESAIELISEFALLLTLKEESYELKGYRVNESKKILGTLCFKVI